MKFAKPLAALFLLLSLFSGSPAFAQSDEAECETFYAGQTIDVGLVCVTIDTDNNEVILDYLLDNGWTLSEAHAWIGDDMATLPRNKKGNPQNGRFPYSASNLGGVTHHSFTIPVSQLNVNTETFCAAEIFVAAHGVVSKASGDTGGKKGGKGGGTESAWAGTTQLSSGGNWSRIYSFTNDFCGDDDPGEPPVVPLAAGCFNVFGRGDDVNSNMTVTPYTPVGVTGTTSAWINTFDSAAADPQAGIGGDLVGAAGRVGSILAGLTDPNTLYLEIGLDSAMTSTTPPKILASANVYVGTGGSFQIVSPLDFGNPKAGDGTIAPLTYMIPFASTTEDFDVVIHAVVCQGPSQ